MSSADRAALLEDLDAKRAAGLPQRKDYPSSPRLAQDGCEVLAEWSDGARAVWIECYDEADAALIVAAVNALSELVAEVRRLEAERDALHAAGEKTLLDANALVAEVRAEATEAFTRGYEQGRRDAIAGGRCTWCGRVELPGERHRVALGTLESGEASDFVCLDVAGREVVHLPGPDAGGPAPF